MLSLDEVERLPLDSAFKQHVMGEVRTEEREDDDEEEGYYCYRVDDSVRRKYEER